MPLFLHPAFLFALAGVAIPVLIHFLTRPRPRTLRFPAFRLLLEAGGGQQALDRLRTILLLLCRSLAVTALVLAFAWPLWQRGPASDDPAVPGRTVIIVDASASMAASPGGLPLFTQAVAQAADLLGRLERGSQAAVIFAGARPHSVLPALSSNIATLHEGLRAATVTAEAADPAAALALAVEMLDGPGVIAVFSDLQRSNWGAVDLGDLGPVQVHLRPVTRQAVENAGITDLRLAPTRPVAGETADLIVTVFNAAGRGRELELVMETSGLTSRRRITVGAYASAQAIFPISQPRVGVHPGSVRLEPGDALPLDDQHHFVIRVAPRFSGLVLCDQPPSELDSGALLTARALDPDGQGETGIAITSLQPQVSDRRRLEEAGLVVLVPPIQLPGEVAEILARRIDQGLVVMAVLDQPGPGDALSALQAIAAAAAEPFELPLTDAEDDPPDHVIHPASGFRLTLPLLARGPIQAFADLDADPFAAITVHRRRALRAAPGRQEQVILWYDDEVPALALSRVGQGGLALINVPVAPRGSDLVGTSLFSPLLHECLRHLRSAQSADEAVPGLDWQHTLAIDGPVQVRDPHGQAVAHSATVHGRHQRLRIGAVAEPGLYPIVHGDTVIDYAVVNLDARETDTRPIAAEDLVDPDADTPVFVHDDERRLALAGRPQALWPWLVLIAAAALAGECLIAILWRRGRPAVVGGRS